MMKFNKTLIETPSYHELFVAVSMGEDSVAISHFLSQGPRQLHLVYVNHGTDYSSTAEKRFSEYVEYLNKSKPQRTPEIRGTILRNSLIGSNTSEADLREIRYNAFDAFLPERSELVVCHHLSDCVESYLMNCFNGVPEYAPIPFRTERTKYSVIRPFLSTPKQNIKEYLSLFNLFDYVVEDPSNTDTAIRRNWLRHVIIPQIKDKYPGIDTVVRKMI